MLEKAEKALKAAAEYRRIHATIWTHSAECTQTEAAIRRQVAHGDPNSIALVQTRDRIAASR